MQKEPPKEPNFFRFEELRVYHKALNYTAWLRTKLTVQSLSDDCEANKLVSAATQIAINLAEGSARKQTQFVYFLKLAKSQIRECMVRTDLCQRLNLLNKPESDYSRGQLFELSKMVTALIISITHEPGDEVDDNENPGPSETVHQKHSLETKD